MSTEINNIQHDIIASVNNSITDTTKTIKKKIDSVADAVQNHKNPNGKPFTQQVRSLRIQALSLFGTVKTDILTTVSSSVIQEARASGFFTVQEEMNKIHENNAKKAKAIEGKQRILNETQELTDYDKFKQFDEKEHTVIEKTEIKYKRKSLMTTTSGIIIALFCTFADILMIYPLFEMANYEPALAVLNAIIIALILDVPPYVLGKLVSGKNDTAHLWELKSESHTKAFERKMRNFRNIIGIVCVVTIIMLLFYIAFRILSFLGGGNFSIAFSMILSNNFHFEAIDTISFNGADFMTIIGPLATSAVSYAMGMYLTVSYAEYVKDANIVINEELKKRVEICEETIVDCEKNVKIFMEDIDSLKREIWAQYIGNKKPFPSNNGEFKQEVSIAYQKLHLTQYINTYEACCRNLRNSAVAMLNEINYNLAQHAQNSADILSINIDNIETNMLNDFWTISNSNQPAVQCEQTIADIEFIEEQIMLVADALK